MPEETPQNGEVDIQIRQRNGIYHSSSMLSPKSPPPPSKHYINNNHNNSNSNNQPNNKKAFLQDDISLRDKSKLLLLAEQSKNSPTKKPPSPGGHLLSFRNSLSPSKKSPQINKRGGSTPNSPYDGTKNNGNNNGGSSFLRRNNSTALSPSQPQSPSKSSSTSLNQNPKLYTSFSSKSASKLTKAFIKSDPAKTNIEHLVASPRQISPDSNFDNVSNSNNNSSSGGGLTKGFITPLKALHASFHDRSKLAHAFAPRSRLFSQRDKSGSNIRGVVISHPVIIPSEHEQDARFSPQPYPTFDSDTNINALNGSTSSSPDNQNGQHSPDFLEYYGLEQSTPSPTPLRDCLEVDQESGYIRVHHYHNPGNPKLHVRGIPSNSNGIPSIPTPQSQSIKIPTSSPRIPLTFSMSEEFEPPPPIPPKQRKSPPKTIPSPPIVILSNAPFNSNNPSKSAKVPLKSTATPIKPSACRAQIISLSGPMHDPALPKISNTTTTSNHTTTSDPLQSSPSLSSVTEDTLPIDNGPTTPTRAAHPPPCSALQMSTTTSTTHQFSFNEEDYSKERAEAAGGTFINNGRTVDKFSNGSSQPQNDQHPSNKPHQTQSHLHPYKKGIFAGNGPHSWMDPKKNNSNDSSTDARTSSLDQRRCAVETGANYNYPSITTKRTSLTRNEPDWQHDTITDPLSYFHENESNVFIKGQSPSINGEGRDNPLLPGINGSESGANNAHYLNRDKMLQFINDHNHGEYDEGEMAHNFQEKLNINGSSRDSFYRNFDADFIKSDAAVLGSKVSRKLSARKLSYKLSKQKAPLLMRSWSFRSVVRNRKQGSDEEEDFDKNHKKDKGGCGYSRICDQSQDLIFQKDDCGNSADGNGKKDSSFHPRRSRSLPKSFMRKGLQTVLPSRWTCDHHHFDKLDDLKGSGSASSSTGVLSTPTLTLPSGPYPSQETAKMRWQKSSSSAADGRPKSFDFSQRKAWMRYYRDMEVSSATSSQSLAKSKGSSISKGSITHLHLVNQSSTEDFQGGQIPGHGGSSIRINPNPSDVTEPCINTITKHTNVNHLSSGSTRRVPTDGLPSLMQRFSKTFSLRFGSSSSVNKPDGQHKGTTLGSSPDLIGPDGLGKMRKGAKKAVRGEKCQSGDSGIGMDEPHPHLSGNNRLRRIRSEVIETTSASTSCDPNPSSTSGSSRGAATSSKMSLVEIPNACWDSDSSPSSTPTNSSSIKNGISRSHTQLQKNGSNLHNSSRGSYEDILEARLDQDDGFSSEDDNGGRGSHYSQQQSPSLYHTLPLKTSRKSKKANTTSSEPEVNPPVRTRSLEDDKGSPVDNQAEDNSIRGKVIKEIISTEQNYVKTLNDIVQGFLNPCRANPRLFTRESIRDIFSNIEDILRLHARFLEALKEQVNPACISVSKVGQVFTKWAETFNIYSEYCCNNPISMATVRSLIQNEGFAEFFEACRKLQLMDKLPLHGFLLRPIQRICQYHLQLNELLKQTPPSNEDYPSVVQALETMKGVAMKINETQKQFDYLQEILGLQNSIEGWEGSNLISRNSVVLQKGELVKTAMGKRSKEVQCFLFNKDLVYCKKDFIKKSGFVFDGRIDLEVGVWLNIDSNEEDEFFGMVHNSWRIYSPELRTWVLFTASSPLEKRKWVTALERILTPYHVDPKMVDMAKRITMLAEADPFPTSHHYSSHSSSNTLPKSTKKHHKGKHSSTNSNGLGMGKVDAEAMLIEVSKLKGSAYSSQSSHHHPISSKDRSSSKFYV